MKVVDEMLRKLEYIGLTTCTVNLKYEINQGTLIKWPHTVHKRRNKKIIREQNIRCKWWKQKTKYIFNI